MAEKKFYVAYVARECGMNIGAFAASPEEGAKLLETYIRDRGKAPDTLWIREFESIEDVCIRNEPAADVLVINDKEEKYDN